jgi:hypothetical protein
MYPLLILIIAESLGHDWSRPRSWAGKHKIHADGSFFAKLNWQEQCTEVEIVRIYASHYFVAQNDGPLSLLMLWSYLYMLMPSGC